MKTVLIVEDEKMIRQGIKTMIMRSGVPIETIMECNNGETALEILKEQEIDVMFTDIRMPKMDGIELVQKMQSLEHIPLTVAISGYDDFAYAVEMLRNGVREYILKPIEREKITEILKKLNAEKNVTFLISSHMAGEIEKTCNKVAVIYVSELIATSTTEDALRLHPSMEDYFLSVVKDRRGEIII